MPVVSLFLPGTLAFFFFFFPGFGAQIQVLYSSENNVLLLSKLTQDPHINITVLKNLCCSAKRMASHKL
jgi:hypothetical protein